MCPALEPVGLPRHGLLLVQHPCLFKHVCLFSTLQHDSTLTVQQFIHGI